MMDVSVARVVEWLSRLVQIPSVGVENVGPPSGPSSEAALVAQLSTWFAAFGAKIEQEEVLPGRPNLYAVWSHDPYPQKTSSQLKAHHYSA